MNEAELLAALRTIPDIHVQQVRPGPSHSQPCTMLGVLQALSHRQ